MTCELRTFGSVLELDDVIKAVGISDKHDDEFDDSWKWPEEIEEGDSNSLSSGSAEQSWISKCCISFSPHGETLAIGYSKHLFIYTAKWDSQEQGENKVKYLLKWQGDPRGESTEMVTCILCLPMAAQGRISSSHSAPDWTAIAVGFDSGAVRFYTELGSLLLSEKLHCGPVWNIKCQTLIENNNDSHDELHVFYRDTVCSIPGMVVTSTLKAYRNQLAKVLAGVGSEHAIGGLACSKWQFGEQATVNDAVVLGLQTPTLWSHLTSACIGGGYHANYSSLPLTRSDVVATGSRPFVANHSIREGLSGPVLSDVAKAVASKLKSAIGGLLGGSRKEMVEKNKDRPALEPAEPMTCRFGLTDLCRKGERIIICPYKKLYAVSDSFGRVSLIDVETGLALRVWKGYRDAQCGFVPTCDNRTFNQKALFLVIYGPKKGVIEIWALHSGPKVASFQVSKNGRLLYSNYGLMNVTSSFNICNTAQYPCIFLDDGGVVKYVSVPFHIILSAINNKKAKDSHILKQIKKHLGTETSEIEIPALIKQINSSEIMIQLFEVFMKSKHTNPELLKLFVSAISKRMKNQDLECGGSLELYVSNMCKNLNKLLVIYDFFLELRDTPPLYTSVVNESSDDQGLGSLLRATDKEIDNLLNNLAVLNESLKSKVTFDNDRKTFSWILSCFSWIQMQKQLPIRIVKNSKHISSLGELLCSGVLSGTCSIDKWKTVIEGFFIPQDLLLISICYWLSKPSSQNPVMELMNFSVLISAICSMADPKEINFWWPEIRTLLSNSANTPATLSVVYVLRSISLADEDLLNDKGDGDWVAISQECCIWTQMIAQLEAIILLQSAIKYKNKGIAMELVPCLEVKLPDLTLEKFLTLGPGLVVEVVAQWIGSWGLAIEWVCGGSFESAAASQPLVNPTSPPLTPVVDGYIGTADFAREAVPSTVGQEGVLSHLKELITKFPHTLCVDNLVANLAWEYSLAWTKDKYKILYLHYALRALQAIRDVSLKHGLCCLMWSAHLFGGFESTVRLIHNIGKVPNKEKCLTDIGVPDSAISQLLNFYVQFFSEFIKSSVLKMNGVESRECLVEALWNDAPPSLTRLATSKSCDNIPLLVLKCQCASALHLLVSFPVKFNRPVSSLFDDDGDILLLNDVLNQAVVPDFPPHQKVIEARTSFLKRIMSAILKCFSRDPKESNLTDTTEWLARCYNLASDWNLDLDDLRRHQVLLLYVFNHDKLAEEVIPSINDKEKLGSELLNIAGRRLKTILSGASSHEVKETLALLSPSLSSWIQSSECFDLEVDISSVKHLSEIILSLICDLNSDYSLAKSLYDSLQLT